MATLNTLVCVGEGFHHLHMVQLLQQCLMIIIIIMIIVVVVVVNFTLQFVYMRVSLEATICSEVQIGFFSLTLSFPSVTLLQHFPPFQPILSKHTGCLMVGKSIDSQRPQLHVEGWLFLKRITSVN